MEAVASILQDGNSFLLFFIGVSVVVVLMILLIVLFAEIRVKRYKEQFHKLASQNNEKAEKLKLQAETLEEKKGTIETLEKQLMVLQNKEEKFIVQEKQSYEIEKELEALKLSLLEKTEQLEVLQNHYGALVAQHQVLQQKEQTLREQNNKLSINNTRLLRKLNLE
jgi:Na+-transporting methylmalonyl-CoA/oxaloacetate decarboxylase gamma subunit